MKIFRKIKGMFFKRYRTIKCSICKDPYITQLKDKYMGYKCSAHDKRYINNYSTYITDTWITENRVGNGSRKQKEILDWLDNKNDNEDYNAETNYILSKLLREKKYDYCNLILFYLFNYKEHILYRANITKILLNWLAFRLSASKAIEEIDNGIERLNNTKITYKDYTISNEWQRKVNIIGSVPMIINAIKKALDNISKKDVYVVDILSKKDYLYTYLDDDQKKAAISYGIDLIKSKKQDETI